MSEKHELKMKVLEAQAQIEKLKEVKNVIQAASPNKFQKQWLEEERFKGWLTHDEKKNKAVCLICDVELMPSRNTLILHGISEKHELKMKVLEAQAQIEKLKEVKNVNQAASPSKFQKQWLEEERFKGWLAHDEKKDKAICLVCDKELMPQRNTLIIHGNSEMHELKMKVLEAQAQIEMLKLKEVKKDVNPY